MVMNLSKLSPGSLALEMKVSTFMGHKSSKFTYDCARGANTQVLHIRGTIRDSLCNRIFLNQPGARRSNGRKLSLLNQVKQNLD